MSRLLSLHHRFAAFADRQADWALPTLARLVFAGVLLGYFWASAMTKLDGPFSPSLGGYAQVFPRVFEAAGYDASQMGLWPRLVVLAGTYAEYLLPALIVLGLFTRLAALGMAGFILVQSLTDIHGHGASAGAWFDRASDALILDQRAFWMLALVVLVVKGAGPVALDRLVARWEVRLPA